jgi:hypothetical protein
MKMVLFGTGYTLPRIGGILHEVYLSRIGKLQSDSNGTIYGEGDVVINSLTQEIGLIVDTESPFFALGEPHLSRLVEVITGDGWQDTVEGE